MSLEKLAEEEFVLEILLGTSATFEDSNSTSTSDSDEDQMPRGKRTRVFNFVEEVVKNYDEIEFKSHFRMKRTTSYKIICRQLKINNNYFDKYIYIILRIGMLEQSNYHPRNKFGRAGVSSEKSIFITLWYFSNNETFRQIADRFNVTESSAFRVVRRVVQFLCSIGKDIIKWPTNAAEKARISEKFQRISGLKNVLGCIDGSHIEIPKPKNDQDSYCNRKGYHSVILQGIVSHDKKFLDVFCGEPGSMNDARVFRKSGIYKAITDNTNFIGNQYIIGDSAYSNLPWLLSPFVDNGRLTDEQRQFNYLISSARIVIEQAFGLLKGRFRRMRRIDNKNMQFCCSLIMSACVLHNICINEDDVLDFESNYCNDDQNQPSTIAHLEQDSSSKIIFKVFKEMFPDADI